MLVVLIIFIASFILALGFGSMAYIAKVKWRDLERTQRYAMIAIIFTIVFMVVGMYLMPE